MTEQRLIGLTPLQPIPAYERLPLHSVELAVTPSR